MKYGIRAAGVLALAVSIAGAQERPDDISAKVGGGVVVSTSPYRDVGVKARPIPLVAVRYGSFVLQGGRGGAEVLTLIDGLSMSVFFDLFAGARYSVKGSDLPEGYDQIDDRDPQIAGGIEIGWNTGFENLRTSASAAFGGEGNSYELALSVIERFNQGDIVLIPKLSFGMLDGDYSRYYFGISYEEADANPAILAPYLPREEVFTLGASLSSQFRLDEAWSLMAMAGIEWLDDDAKNSPIVSTSTLLGGMLGITYTF